MFYVDGITRSVTLTKGDTGPLTLSAEDYMFSDEDRAILSVMPPYGPIVLQKVLAPQNGKFSAVFLNADTEKLMPGDYHFEVRFVLHPYYDASGKIVNGNQIISFGPMTLRLLPVVNHI